MTVAEPSLDRSQQRQVLRACDHALGQEAHNLQQWPETTWQQLCNRLQFVDAPIPDLIAAEAERRSQPGIKPWIRAQTPSPESGSMIRVLDGHTLGVMAVAWSPDGARLASGASDRTVRVWDAASGALMQTIPLRGMSRTVAFHPFEPRLAVGNDGGEIWVGGWLLPYGPLVVTIVDRGSGPEARCPGCQQTWSVTTDDLGHDMSCPAPGCGLVLRLNRFVLKPNAESQVEPDGQTVDWERIRAARDHGAQQRYALASRDWEALPWWRKLFSRRPTPPDAT